MTTQKRKPFKPRTYNALDEAESLFTEDLRGLFKVHLPVKVMGKQVRYMPVSLPQAAYMINFIVDGFAPLLISEEEQRKLNREELFSKVIEYVSEETSFITSEIEEERERAEGLIGAAFSSKAAIQFLLPVMQQCFPDLNVYKITNDCFLECFNILFTEMFSTNK